MKLNKIAAGSALALIFGLSQVASAHPGHNNGAGFAAGASHPFSGLDHVLAMIAVGLLAAQVGGKALWQLPLTFVGLMIGGGLLALAGVSLPMTEQGIMASVLVLGLAVAFAARLPAGAMIAMVGAFAVFHGYAHVAEMNAGAGLTSYAVGFVVATAMLHAVGIGLGMSAKRVASSATLVRLGGAAIAGCGVLLFLHVL